MSEPAHDPAGAFSARLDHLARGLLQRITADAQGNVHKKQEGRSGDGKPDLAAWFENAKLQRLEQDTNGSVLSADTALTSYALVTTCLAAAAGAMGGIFTSWIAN